MDPYTNNHEIDTYIKDRIKNLPQELQSLVRDRSFSQKIGRYAEDAGLTDEEMRLLQYQILLILMQLRPIDDLTTELITEVGMEFSKAEEIYKWVHDDLLYTVLPLLTNLPDEERERGTLQDEPPTTTEGTSKYQDASAQKSVAPIQTHARKMTSLEAKQQYSIPQSHTMPKDIAALRQESKEGETKTSPAGSPNQQVADVGNGQSEINRENTSSNVPRYAKPLTDTPRYREEE